MKLKIFIISSVITLYILIWINKAYNTLRIKDVVIECVINITSVHNKKLGRLKLEIAFWIFLICDTFKKTLNSLLLSIIIIQFVT